MRRFTPTRASACARVSLYPRRSADLCPCLCAVRRLVTLHSQFSAALAAYAAPWACLLHTARPHGPRPLRLDSLRRAVAAHTAAAVRCCYRSLWGAGYLPAWIEPRAVHRVVQAPPTRAGLRRFGTSSTTLMLRRAPRRPPLPIPTSTVGWAHMRTERDALAHAASGMQRRDAHVRMAERHRAGSPVRALLHEQSDQPCCGSCVLEPTHPTRDCLTRRIAIGQVRPSPPLCIDPASVSAAAVGAESAGRLSRLIRLGEWLTRAC